MFPSRTLPNTKLMLLKQLRLRSLSLMGNHYKPQTAARYFTQQQSSNITMLTPHLGPLSQHLQVVSKDDSSVTLSARLLMLGSIRRLNTNTYPTGVKLSDKMRKYKPTSAGVRHRITTSREGLWGGRPNWLLTRGKRRINGRCRKTGRITVRARGGGAKRLYRKISFKLKDMFGEYQVERLEYDPNRSCRIALVKSTGCTGPIRVSSAAEEHEVHLFDEEENPELYALQQEAMLMEQEEKEMGTENDNAFQQLDAHLVSVDPLKKCKITDIVDTEILRTMDRSNVDARIQAEQIKTLQYTQALQSLPKPSEEGELRYMLAPYGVETGMTFVSGPHAKIEVGNSLPLKYIPQGTQIFNIEINRGRGSQLVRSAGVSAVVLDLKTDHHGKSMVLIRLPSLEQRWFSGDNYATVGRASNINHRLRQLGKAGASRWIGRRPSVRGAAKNAKDHPHGSSQKSKGGKPLRSWKGKPLGSRLAGVPTRKKNKYSDVFVLKAGRIERRRKAGYKGP